MKNIIGKILDLLTKRKRKQSKKLDVNVLFLLNCMFPHQNTSLNNYCPGRGGLSNEGDYLIDLFSIFSRGGYLIRGLSSRGLSTRFYGTNVFVLCFVGSVGAAFCENKILLEH